MNARLNSLVGTVGIAVLGLVLMSCQDVVFTAKNSPTSPTLQSHNDPGTVLPNGDLLFIDDSFERENLYADTVNNIVYGWRGVITDKGTSTEAFTGDQLGMQIFDAQEMGPAFDGNRAVYFYGRTDADTHALYLVSAAYDLSAFNSVVLSYRYLTVALNDLEDQNAGFIEGIKLQVCNGPANLCGADHNSVDPTVLANSPNWFTLTASDPNFPDDQFDGTNHSPSDFRLGQAVIDLNDESIVFNKSNFVFRFVVTLRDGFPSGAVLPASLGIGQMIDTSLLQEASATVSQKGSGRDLQAINSNDELDQYACGRNKVLICHVPPGNPSARHTLCLGRPAVEAHLKHHRRNGEAGDHLGSCEPQNDLCEQESEACVLAAQYEPLCRAKIEEISGQDRFNIMSHASLKPNLFQECKTECAKVKGKSAKQCKEQCDVCRLHRHYQEQCHEDRKHCPDGEEPVPTSTPTPTTVPPTATPSPSPVPPTATPSPSPVPPTATPSPSPVPPTATPSPSPVPPTLTPTPTPVPPTLTPTPSPTPVPLVLLDGVILDLVQGVASTRDASELF